jgi:predicted double-glycine peptidase
MVKTLRKRRHPGIRQAVPYYAQTLEFTCGPACLMMAMKYHDPGLTLDRSLELTLWKEATLIFMTSGLGGCGPFGLAVAAQRRGLATRVILADRQIPLLNSIPIVLVSTYRLHRVKAPHWVVVTGFDRRNVYFHDPYEGFSTGQAQHVRLPIPEFRRMRRYGKAVNKSIIFVAPGHRVPQATSNRCKPVIPRAEARATGHPSREKAINS